TSLSTYVVNKASMGYLHDGRTVGVQYKKFAWHKSGLDGMATILDEQKAGGEELWEEVANEAQKADWIGNMAKLGQKFEFWCKEAAWEFGSDERGIDHDYSGERSKLNLHEYAQPEEKEKPEKN
ncbi:MAG: hypothetical protein Q9226_006902, partial [Calogaya cf. arnoldii]